PLQDHVGRPRSGRPTYSQHRVWGLATRKPRGTLRDPTLMIGRRIQRDRRGGFRLKLPTEERELLASLPSPLRDVLREDETDPALRRLFPPAYGDDPLADDEYRRLMRAELLDGKLAALSVVEQTAYADRLTGEELEGWLGALESLRLYLGTQL